MQIYKDRDGDSGVMAYEIGPGFIKVQFKRRIRVYTYSYQRAGKLHVDRMKLLAQSGDGLNTYINKYVKLLYDRF